MYFIRLLSLYTFAKLQIIVKYMAIKHISSFCIYVEFEPYLQQWLIHENGDKLPVVFPKLSVENRILQTFLIKPPSKAQADFPNPGTLPIGIPHFRHTNPAVYNYLPIAAKHELRNCIRNRFIIQLWSELHRFGYIGKRKDHLIEAWMQRHGIEVNDTNFNTIVKIYQRQHKAYTERTRLSQKKSKKTKY